VVGSSVLFHIFPQQCGHVNDPPALTGLSTLQQLVAHISHQEKMVLISEHNDNSFCDFVHLCVLELFTANDWSECQHLVKTVPASLKVSFRTLVMVLEKNNRKYKTIANSELWGIALQAIWSSTTTNN
jgi:diaminopimelate decarboxylase